MLVTLLFIITINKFLVNVFDQNMEKKYSESMSIKAFFLYRDVSGPNDIIEEIDIYNFRIRYLWYNLEIMNLVTKKNKDDNIHKSEAQKR